MLGVDVFVGVAVVVFVDVATGVGVFVGVATGVVAAHPAHLGLMVLPSTNGPGVGSVRLSSSPNTIVILGLITIVSGGRT